jgi:hypothetical protein
MGATTILQRLEQLRAIISCGAQIQSRSTSGAASSSVHGVEGLVAVRKDLLELVRGDDLELRAGAIRPVVVAGARAETGARGAPGRGETRPGRILMATTRSQVA